MIYHYLMLELFQEKYLSIETLASTGPSKQSGKSDALHFDSFKSLLKKIILSHEYSVCSCDFEKTLKRAVCLPLPHLLRQHIIYLKYCIIHIGFSLVELCTKK